MQIVIECNEYVTDVANGKFCAIVIESHNIEIKCRKECLDLANKAVRAALDILKGEKA
jgi:hypothetical protein